MAKVFKTPFAAQGDKTPIPEPTQTDGSVSYNQGFGFDYERDYADPLSKDIARESMNQVFNDLSGAVGEIQATGTAQWQAEAGPYPMKATVWHDGMLYQSTIAANSNTPPGAGWQELDALRLRNATEAVRGVAQIASLSQAQAGVSADTIITPNTLSRIISRDAGEVAFFARQSPPVGWLLANGATVLRSSYPDLFLAVGAMFGAGNGTTTFRLPDLRGEFIRGYDGGRGSDPGRVMGSYQNGQIEAHKHSVSVHRADDFNFGIHPMGSDTTDGIMDSPSVTSTGGAETRPRNVALLACIRY